MRTTFIAGNWKMNLLVAESCELARKVRDVSRGLKDVEIAVAPPATSLGAVIDVLRGSSVGVAAQNCHWKTSGAYTGEVSPEMIRDIGCVYVIIGHSERRQYFGETDKIVNKKIHAAFRAGLKPIVCIGETLEQREADKTMDVVCAQLNFGLKNLNAKQMENLTLAYEPVWAIGTGRTSTPQQAQEVHAYLRAQLKKLFDPDVAEKVRIQYGGSVKPSNVKNLMAQPDIDGALVGGASLKAESFSAILKYQN